MLQYCDKKNYAIVDAAFSEVIRSRIKNLNFYFRVAAVTTEKEATRINSTRKSYQTE